LIKRKVAIAPHHNLNFFWKRIMFGMLIRPVFVDHELQEKLFRASGPELDNRAARIDYGRPCYRGIQGKLASSDRSLTLKIARADIANFLSRQLSDMRYAQKAVGISN